LHTTRPQSPGMEQPPLGLRGMGEWITIGEEKILGR
jgi:hypothetical protein